MAFFKSGKCLFYSLLLILAAIPHLHAESGVYDRIGIIAEHGLHGAVPEENIDLFTGNLTLKNLDIHLPGPNGFDLNIWRVYNSKILKDRLPGSAWGIQQEPYSWVGIGWSMHMGRLHNFNTETPVIEYPDGRWETAYHNIDDYATFITRDFAKLDKSNWKLYFKDGTVWTFGTLANIRFSSTSIEQVRVVTQITNSYGHQINITYDGSGSPRMSTITDSLGRTINFILENNYLYKLDYISVKNANGSVVNYEYTVDSFNGDYYKLTSFDPPVLPAATYEYDSGLSSNWELLAVNTSYGGRMEYEYVEHDFYYYTKILNTKVIYNKKIKFSSGAAFSTWAYSYPSYYNTATGTVTVTGPDFTSNVSYHAYTASTPWKIGLLNEKHFADGSASEQYEWTSQIISDTHWYVLNIDMGQAKAPLLQRTTKNCSGDSSIIEEYLYERSGTSRYGLPTRINVYGGGTLKNYRTLQYYFEYDSSFATKYMLNLLRSETLYNGSSAKLKETIMSYYANGAFDSVQKLKSGSTYLLWDYGYASSNPNNITITIDLPGTGGTETMTYKYGVLATLTHPGYTEFTRTISAYDSSILSETNQHGAVMNFDYDNLGRITAIDMPSGFNDIAASWSTNYVTITQGGNTVNKYWDGMGRDTGHTEQGDGITLYYRKSLDSEGRTTTESKGSTDSADTYVYVYNAAGQIKKITDPRGKITNINMSGNQKTVIDANSNSTTFEYNHLPGLVSNLTDANGKTAAYTYDGAGRLLGANFNSSRTQSYEYNALDQITSENHPETGAITYAYNTANNLEIKTWGGQSTGYTYNAANQLLTENAGDETITYTYDNKGRVASITGGLGWSKTSIGYNSFGNVTQETITIPGLSAKTVSYDYDGNNQLGRITYPDGRYVDYTNNGLNMPETITFNGSTMVNAITYGIHKQPTAVKITANGTSYAASYNGIGGVSNAQLKKSGSFLNNADYTYDNVGNIASLNNSYPDLNASFSYDNLKRLNGASYSPSGIGRVNNFVYNYDEYGNMTSAKENNLTIFSRTYTNQNRISGMSYDARGNATQGDGYSQAWDNRNRLSESRITATSFLLGRYVYDERGLRLKAERFSQPTVQMIQPNGGESLYQGDPITITWSSTGQTGTIKLELLVNDAVAGTIAENLPATQTSYPWQAGKILTGWVNPGSNFKVRVSTLAPSVASTSYYFYDNSGRLLSEYEATGNETPVCVKDYIYMGNRLLAEYQPLSATKYYYTSDQINSTRIITDSSGSVVYSAVFDPYGGMQKQWVNTYQPSLKFSGKEREVNTELDYFGARYYGHTQYRFISVDPVINKDEVLANPQLWNLYSYCRNNPITFLDLNGLTEITISVNRSNENTTRTLGTLSVTNDSNNTSLSLYTLERPDNNNQQNTSRINADEYSATKWWSNEYNQWRVRLEDKNNRTNILIHGGTNVDDTTGCILVGTAQSDNALTPGNARQQLIDYIENIETLDTQNNQSTTIKVIVNSINNNNN
jgi:RHS repeat-associated protein